jgi:NRPS condensation-like uncharacterized protein
MKRELGAFERALWISDHHSAFHIVCVLRLEDAPPPEVVRRSLAILQKRHPFLSARLVHAKRRHYFTKLPSPPLPFRSLFRWNDDHWTLVAETELASRIDALTGPMFRCAYLHSENDARAEIILALSHFITDAASASQLLHELITICASLMDGKPVSVPELPPAPPLESRFPPAFKGWRRAVHTVRYALAQMQDEVSYRWMTGRGRMPPLHESTAHGRILPVQIPEELIEPFAQRARREGVTLNSALNAAMLLSVNRHLYAGQGLLMRTFAFANLRPYVEPPLGTEHLASYISMLRYTVHVKGEGDFWSLARELHAKIHSSFKSGDKFIASVMAESLMKMVTRFKAFRMGATALNYNGAAPVQTEYGDIKVVGVHGYVSAFEFGPELSSQAGFFKGQLIWDFMYLEEDMSREKAEAIVEEIKGIMRSSVIVS